MERKYAMILGNLGNTRDRFCSGYKANPSTTEMLQQAVKIPFVSGIELVGTWDIDENNAGAMKRQMEDLGLACVSIIPDLFANPLYWKGSYTAADPQVRQAALDYSRKMCEIALELRCPLLNLWPGQDGYDYLLAADYDAQRQWMCEAVSQLAQEFPALKFALEYKPKEPRTHSTLARMADSLLMVLETGQKNIGVTIDTGHAYVAGEVVGESIVLARRAGNKLFHMHFNDNHASWDDDMIVGTVHSIAYLETLYWLDRTGYSGWLSMDQYPYREDGAGAIGESILWLHRFDEILQANRSEIDHLISEGDAIQTSRFLRKALLSA
jgi:sugar phosphate isomerase/epimerase